VATTNLIGTSARFQTVLDDIQVVAPAECAVLVQGETGTGKEVISRAIHESGPRRNGPFIGLNCAAIPGALLESELFGHERGAFTGAVTQTTGRFLALIKEQCATVRCGTARLPRTTLISRMQKLGIVRTSKLSSVLRSKLMGGAFTAEEAQLAAG
jgi:hypothetical protein